MGFHNLGFQDKGPLFGGYLSNVFGSILGSLVYKNLFLILARAVYHVGRLSGGEGISPEASRHIVQTATFLKLVFGQFPSPVGPISWAI